MHLLSRLQLEASMARCVWQIAGCITDPPKDFDMNLEDS